jgi:O-acetyl-ADP-ribose deacetylase (regulator of RNase III)
VRVRLALGSVADQPADVLVRIAPTTIIARSVDALLARAGPEITAVCRNLRREGFPHGLPVGETVVTPGGLLPAPWLVHVVVPIYSVKTDRAYQLSAAYRACLREADALGARTVAMPAFGAWDPFWPLLEATRIGLGTLEGTPTKVRELRLTLSNPAALEFFAEALARR